jgi:hypothetical protein
MDVWGQVEPQPRKDILKNIEKDAVMLQAAGCQEEILLCFMADPYHSDNGGTETTRQALQIIGEHDIKAQVLTKGGTRAIRDFDLLERYGFKFGSTICFLSEDMREHWEPYAPSISNRVEAIKEAHRRGIFTWVSIEPVIDASEALTVVDKLSGYVNFWKIGKLNHNKEVEAKTDWNKFVNDVEKKLNGYGEDYYIKKDLLKYKE